MDHLVRVDQPELELLERLAHQDQVVPADLLGRRERVLLVQRAHLVLRVRVVPAVQRELVLRGRRDLLVLVVLQGRQARRVQV